MRTFYVYAVYEVNAEGTELPIYIGKGHDNSESGYSRVACYAKFRGVTRQIRAKIEAAIAESRPWAVRKIADADNEVHAFALERQFIAEIGREFLVNCTDGGCAGWTMREESRRKMSEAHKGKKLGPISDEHRQHLRESARRRAANPAWCAAHSKMLSGRTWTKEHCQNISAAVKGVSKTQAHRNAISRGKTGLKQSEEHRRNNALAHTGLKVGPYKTRCDKLPEEERQARRKDTFQRSYAKRSEKILAGLQAERDAERRAKLGVAADAPLPTKITHLTKLDDAQKALWHRLRERFNYARRQFPGKFHAQLDALRTEAEVAIKAGPTGASFEACLKRLDVLRGEATGYHKSITP